MKIIISENQELNVKQRIVFFLLDKQKYNLVEINNRRIYFVKNIGDEYAEIRYDKYNGWCWITLELFSLLSKFVGFEELEYKESKVKELIGKWVEHTLQIEVKNKSLTSPFIQVTLKMPNN